MKTLKLKIINACLVIGFLLLGANAYSQTNINVNNGGSYYLCVGSSYTLTANVPSGSTISQNYWLWNGTYYLTLPAYFDNLELTNFTNANYVADISCLATSTSSIPVQVEYEYMGTDYYLNFTLYIDYTTITGTTNFCDNTNQTYTAVTNISGLSTGDYSWTLPSFLSGSSTSYQDATTTTGTGSGSVTVTVSGGASCPTGSASNVGDLAVESYTSPGTPSGGITWTREGLSCYYYASISAVSGAEYYEWSINGGTSFFNTTTVPNSGTVFQEFECGTSYNVYVRVTNPCNYTYKTWSSQSTPTCPNGCAHAPYKPSGGLSMITDDFKVYPNPANSQITIEYPSADDNSTLSLSIYDMLGHKMASYNLPASDNIITEDTSVLPTGLYLYMISSGSDIINRGKIMIQK